MCFLYKAVFFKKIRFLKKIPFVILFLSVCYSGLSQNDTISIQQLDTVMLQVNRIPILVRENTAAVSVYKASQDDVARQQLSLQEYVWKIPGVYTQNATNFAQDLRISIRGFGARSSFGIRGVKLIVDGIPETTPDGQGQLDNLNLGIVEQLEVLKGPSSSLYGNASGGVISLTTKTFDSIRGSFSDWKVGVGSFGFQNYQATAGIGDANANYLFHASYTQSDGYRDQSGFEQINTNFKGAFRLSENLNLTAILNYSDSPLAEDPGGLTLEEVQNNRKQARQRNIDFATQESVQQLKAGLSLSWQKTKFTEIDAYAFYSNRSFRGRLPFEFGGVVNLDRNYVGQGTSITYKKHANTLKTGYDFAYQNDARARFFNIGGETGDKTLDQDEKFTNLGVYLLDHFRSDRWLITGGLRFDYNRLEAEDQFLSNGDDSGAQVLTSFNPSVGINYSFRTGSSNLKINAFANFSTSFETPALSELSANPTGNQGFNEDLDPQKATSYELGVRGATRKVNYQVAIFYIKTKDELISFELAEFPDRDFFRNAGKTKRVGLEVEGNYAFAKAWNASFSYTFSNFKHVDFIISDQIGDFNLPGIPNHVANVGIHYAPEKGLHGSIVTNLVGNQFADDENLVAVQGYELLNARVGYLFDYRKAQLRPYVGINNLLDQKYTDNVRINAFGGRFFEPAPGFNIYGGIVVQL